MGKANSRGDRMTSGRQIDWTTSRAQRVERGRRYTCPGKYVWLRGEANIPQCTDGCKCEMAARKSLEANNAVHQSAISSNEPFKRIQNTFSRLFDIHSQFTWRLLALTFLPVGAPDNCKHNQLGVELIQDTQTHTHTHAVWHSHVQHTCCQRRVLVGPVPLPPPWICNCKFEHSTRHSYLCSQIDFHSLAKWDKGSHEHYSCDCPARALDTAQWLLLNCLIASALIATLFR